MILSMKKITLFTSACLLLTSCKTLENIQHDFASYMATKNVYTNTDSQISSEELLAEGQCPSVEVPEELSMTEDSSISAAIHKCSLGEKSVSVEAKISVKGTNPPPFFVAVTNKSGNLLAKEIFEVEKPVEVVTQLIPLDSLANANSYTILSGFQLQPDELAVNRALLASEKQEMQRTDTIILRASDTTLMQLQTPMSSVPVGVVPAIPPGSTGTKTVSR